MSQSNHLSIEHQIIHALNWEEKYAILISAGKTLPTFPDSQKTNENKIAGCLSPTWISCIVTQEGVLKVSGISKSQIINGLIALLQDKVQHSSIQEIGTWDIKQFEHLHIEQLVTITRQNGFALMIRKIASIAAQHAHD